MPNILNLAFSLDQPSAPVEFSKDGGSTWAPLPLPTTGTGKTASLGSILKGVYAIGQLVLRPVGYPGSAVSNTAAVTVINNVLAVPTGTSATGTSTGTINVAVSSIANQTGYRLFTADAAAGPFTQLYQGTTASYPHTGLAAGQTKYYNWQYLGGGFYDDSPLSTVFSGSTVAALTIALSNPDSTVIAGISTIFTATLNSTAVSYVVFKDASGRILSTQNAAPFTLSYTPQVAGSFTVTATATTSNGNQIISNAISVTATQASVTPPVPNLAVTIGRWDATVNGLQANGNWADCSGANAVLTAVGTPFTVNPTGMKGQPALIGTGVEKFTVQANVGASQRISAIAVYLANPGPVVGEHHSFVAGTTAGLGSGGPFEFFALSGYSTGPADRHMDVNFKWSDYYKYELLGIGYVFDSPMITAFDLDAHRGADTLLRTQSTNSYYSATNPIHVGYEPFQAPLSDQLLTCLTGIKGALQVLHIFNGADSATLNAWIDYYQTRTQNTVQPNTIFAVDAPVVKSLFTPASIPSKVYSTGTEWVMDTNSSSISASVLMGPDGIGVFVNNVFQTMLNVDGPIVIPLGAAGTTRRVRFVQGYLRGNNATEDGVAGNNLIKVAYDPGSTAGWVAPPNKTKFMGILGDSISVGAGPTVSITGGPFQLVGIQRPDIDIYYDGWGNRSWKGGMFTEAQRNISVARWVAASQGYATKIAYIQLGTNDFTGQGTATECAQAAVDYIRVLRASIPTIQIIVQTETGRSNEATDYGGGILQVYRDKLVAAVTGLPGVIKILDGPTLLNSQQTTDGVHPADRYAINPYASGVVAALSSLGL